MARPAKHDADAACMGTSRIRAPMHPMLNIAVRAARRAGSIINRAALDGGGLRGALEARERLRHPGRPRRRGGDHRGRAQGLSRPRHPRRGIGRERGPTPNTSGSSIRSTAPPTSSTASRSTACRSASRTAARSRTAVVYDPTRNELFTASQGRAARSSTTGASASPSCAQLGDALVGTGFPFREADAPRPLHAAS